MNALLSAALNYARAGYRVFPTVEHTKLPNVPRGVSEATHDESEILRWWGNAPRSGIGLACGHDGVDVVDLDMKREKGAERDGLASLREMCAGRPLPDCPVATTPSGGYHLFFKADPARPLRNRVGLGRPDSGVDVRATGGYVVAAPTALPHGAYAWLPGSPPLSAAPAMPEWLRELIGAAAVKSPFTRPELEPYPPASEAVLAAARAALERHGPSVFGAGGNIHAFRAGCILLNDYALDWDSEALPLARAWNEGCKCEARPDGWDDDALERVMHNGLKYASSERGSARLPVDLAEAGPLSSPPVTVYRPLEVRQDSAESAKTLAAPEGDVGWAWSFVMGLYRYNDEISVNYPTLKRWRGAWYAWRRDLGCYQEISKELLLAQILQQSDCSDGEVSTAQKILAALVAVSQVLIPDHVELGTWLDSTDGGDPREIAVCKNGLLNLRTLEMTPSTPRFFSTTCLSVEAQVNAPEPSAWLDSLRNWFNGDAESVQLLREWFGYCLVNDTGFQKLLFILGKKRSGKGTIIRVLRALLGKGSAASLSLADLNGEFGMWQLIGKSAALFPDVRHDARQNSTRMIERLLSITGEDEVSINRKGLAYWTGRVGARVTLCSNVAPDLEDASDALVSRMLVLKMPNTFYGKEDLELGDRLLGELPGILLWAVTGWRSLRARGRFVQPASGSEETEELRASSSPVAAWLSACTTDNPARATASPGAQPTFYPCEAAFLDFVTWCDVNQFKPVSCVAFGKTIKDRDHARVQDSAYGSSGKRLRRYVGLYKRDPET